MHCSYAAVLQAQAVFPVGRVPGARHETFPPAVRICASPHNADITGFTISQALKRHT